MVVFLSCTLFTSLFLIRFFQLKFLVNYLYDEVGEYKVSEETFKEESLTASFIVSKFVAENLQYSFPGKINLIDGFSFAAEKNALTAILGECGTGKSVLADILCGLKAPTSGRLLLDEKDTIPWEQWRKSIGVVFQPPGLMNTSISENLAAVAENPKQVEGISLELGFDQFINRLPDGSATHWSQLSTGYRQLIALLHALIRKPAILVLDEPFSSMDEEMEVFCKKLLSGLKNKMIIVILTSDKNLAGWADVVFQLKPGSK